jgi:hypothetical protein
MRNTSVMLLILTFLLPAQLSAEPVTWYSLQNLQQASSPRQLAVIDQATERIQNLLQHGTLFTYKDRGAAQMYIAGNFTNWRPQAMNRGNNGVWFYFLPDSENRTSIEYKFKRNNIWLYDPMNQSRKADGRGSYVSLVETNRINEGNRVYLADSREKGTEWIEFVPGIPVRGLSLWSAISTTGTRNIISCARETMTLAYTDTCSPGHLPVQIRRGRQLGCRHLQSAKCRG